MINKTRAVLENTMVVFCQAQVSDIFIYCQARVLDTDPTFSCTLTADTDTPADDQQHTVCITEYYDMMVQNTVKLQFQNLDKDLSFRSFCNHLFCCQAQVLIHWLMIDKTPSVLQLVPSWFSVAKATLQSQMSVRLSVRLQNPSTAWIHHHSSFISFILHPSSFFIHPIFISRL